LAADAASGVGAGSVYIFPCMASMWVLALGSTWALALGSTWALALGSTWALEPVWLPRNCS
jgi:hypothetical protein